MSPQSDGPYARIKGNCHRDVAPIEDLYASINLLHSARRAKLSEDFLSSAFQGEGAKTITRYCKPVTRNRVVPTRNGDLENLLAHTDYAAIVARFQKGFVAGGRAGMPAEVVGRTIREALESERLRARYALPTHRLTGWIIPRLLPDRWLDRLIASRVGLVRRGQGRLNP